MYYTLSDSLKALAIALSLSLSLWCVCVCKSVAVEEEKAITLLLWHSSTAAPPGNLLGRPQLAAAVPGPVRILPQFESFYTVRFGH